MCHFPGTSEIRNSASRFHKRKSWSNQYSVHIFCYAICWSTSSGIIKISKNYAMKPKVLELKFAFLSGLKGKIKWKRQFSLEKIWICSFHFIKSYSQWNAGECFSTLLCAQQFTWKCESKFRKTIVKCSASLIKTWMNWISMEKWEFDVQTFYVVWTSLWIFIWTLRKADLNRLFPSRKWTKQFCFNWDTQCFTMRCGVYLHFTISLSFMFVYALSDRKFL